MVLLCVFIIDNLKSVLFELSFILLDEYKIETPCYYNQWRLDWQWNKLLLVAVFLCWIFLRVFPHEQGIFFFRRIINYQNKIIIRITQG